MIPKCRYLPQFVYMYNQRCVECSALIVCGRCFFNVIYFVTVCDNSSSIILDMYLKFRILLVNQLFIYIVTCDMTVIFYHITDPACSIIWMGSVCLKNTILSFTFKFYKYFYIIETNVKITILIWCLKIV